MLASESASANAAWEGGFTVVYQATNDERIDAEATASIDLMGSWETRRGAWFVYIEASSATRDDGISAAYPTANADAGSVLAQDDVGGIQVSELNYTFSANPARTLTVGLIDPTAWLDRSRITNDENLHFVNGSFVNNATIEFPDYTLGFVSEWRARPGVPQLTLIVTGSDGIADTPDRSYQNLLDVTSDERGVFLGLGASWLYDRWSLRLGAWGRSDEHDVVNRPGSEEGNYGAYGVVTYRDGGTAFNLRAGAANPRVSVAGEFVALAVEREFSGGLFGAGIARTTIADGFRTSATASATDAEVFFRLPIFRGAGHLTPSVQYIRNPDFNATGSVANVSSVIFGARLHVAF